VRARSVLEDDCDSSCWCLWEEVHLATSNGASGSIPRLLLGDDDADADDVVVDEDDEVAVDAEDIVAEDEDEDGGNDDSWRRQWKTRAEVVVDCSGIVAPSDTRDAQRRLVEESALLWNHLYHHHHYHHRCCCHTTAEKAPVRIRVDFLEATEKNHHCGPSPFSRPILVRISVRSRGQEHAPEQH
jgi:hypothetical protein